MSTQDPTNQKATPAPNERRNMLQNALAAIERLQGQLDASENARHEPIAIVGMACRFPGDVDTPEKFWQVLAEERNVVTEVPADRWDVDAYYDPDPHALGKARTKAGGFLRQVDEFEPSFFGMSPREAAGVDPQQRLLLEVSWEALEHAAIPADRLDGSRTGVFVGITSMDYSQRIDVSDPARSDIYLATGTALNAAAGRVSFTFGFRGPCMAIDTACSSSLVAIHTACQSLRNGESDLVLAGGVNAILSPDPFVLISKWGMLSPDGRCKTFDASANGFVRGEGCGLLVLERLSDAVANGRRILAVIRGSAINQDGKSSGLTVPNGLAQQEVVQQALASARLQPADVSYVEAHGTGTSLGDPIEVEALGLAYGPGRAADRPLEIGSVKSNIGHLEAAAGVASIIKLVMAMQHKQLPASLHVKTPTPAVAWDALPVRISTALHDWDDAGKPRIAGASAFGFSGMNAHVLVQEAPATAGEPAPQPRQLHVLPLSARSEASLRALAQTYADLLDARADVRVADVCATAARGRAHLPNRTAAIGADRATLIGQLRAFGNGQDASMPTGSAARCRVAFLYTGQGAQYAGMGQALDRSEPVFRETLDRCAAILDPLLGRPLREVLFEDTAGALDQTGFTQPALFALQVSLTALWRSWGIEPSVVLGHSVGEFAAAVTAGVLSLEDAARLIAARGRLMQALPAGGVMVSVQGDPASVRRAIAGYSDVSIAAFNTPDTVVISGAAATVRRVVTELETAGLRTQQLQVSHAFHSPLMDPMLDAFRAIAKDVAHARPTVTWISNLTGAALDWEQWGTRMADYWATHVRQPVEFARSIATLDSLGVEAHVEVGPHPTLINLGTQCLPATPRAVAWLPSLRRNRADLDILYSSVAQLYVRGARIDWNAFYGDVSAHSLQLPTYPFQRQRFLISFAAKTTRPAGNTVHELLGTRLAVAGVDAQFERLVDSESPHWVADHRIAAEVVMPLTAYLETALAAGTEVAGAPVALESINIGEPMALRPGTSSVMQVVVDRITAGAHRIRIFSRDTGDVNAAWTLHATASTSTASADSLDAAELPLSVIAETLPGVMDIDAFYERLRGLGTDFGPQFRGMKAARFGVAEALGEVGLTDGVSRDLQQFRMHPALLDACFHVAAVAFDSLPGQEEGFYLPLSVDRYDWFARPDGPLRVHVKVRPPAVRGEQLILDARIETFDGRSVARVTGMRCRRASRHMFRQRAEAEVRDWLYETIWERLPLEASADVPAGAWLILSDDGGVGRRLAEQLRQRGLTVLRAAAAGADSDADLVIDPDRPESYVEAMASLGPAPLAGVVSLWPLQIPTLTRDTVPSALTRFGTDAALHLLHAAAPAASRLWIVTTGSQPVDGTEHVRVEQAPVAGLARVAAVEYPDLRVTQVDLDPEGTRVDIKLLADELLGGSDETQVALRKGVRWAPRLTRRERQRPTHIDAAPVRLTPGERGTLENIALVPMQRRTPERGEVELRVRASGLNFRDVLSALGMYPGEIRYLGSDCAGEITAVGEGVTQFAVGDRVVAMAEGSFASHAVTRWEFVAKLPDNLSFEQGAAIPTAYLTADITLNVLGGMKAGDRVLIHSGAGGVGMAAIALAHRAGAEIFATAGNDEKRDVLRQMGVQHVLDSRSASFADEIARITHGRGVDFVLNSLAGELLDRSFDCLADGGTFLEIGKRGLWSHERVDALNRGLSYHIVDCNDYARDTPTMVGEIFARVLADIGSGRLPRLRCTTFPFEQPADAFRFMAQARHIGRVVFHHHVEPAELAAPVRADATYLVTGGLRGLGLRAAEWLAAEGARSVVLAGRRAPDSEARAAIDALVASGAQVIDVQADVATEEGIEAIMRALEGRAPLGGVLHCAGVLDDGVLAKQTPERFAAVMGPKADGAWRLHEALARHGHRPQSFVMFSSMSAVLGSAGQGNYVAANAVLDALAHRRRADDLPATSINWGAWAGEGMAARGRAGERLAAQDVMSFSVEQGLRTLGILMREQAVQPAVAPLDWAALAKRFTPGGEPALLRPLIAAARSRAQSGDGVAGGSRERVDFASLDAPARRAQLTTLVRREVATVLALSGSASAIGDDDEFTSLGLDSLTAVELRNRLQTALGRTVPPMAAFDWPTVALMVPRLAELFGDQVEGGAETRSAAQATREEFTV